jgi:prepilin-type N-terminal cleavage/methylation domain-containing protein
MLKQQYKSKRDEGFTIIEVLIVLAIAALILVIVFLAVPALQRSSRNTQRKNDAANTLSAFSDYVSNNGGQLPGDCGGASPCSFLSNVKLGYYDASKVSVVTYASGMTAPDSETLEVVSGAKCGNGQAGAPTAGDSARQYVAYYGIEGNPATQCVEG